MYYTERYSVDYLIVEPEEWIGAGQELGVEHHFHTIMSTNICVGLLYRSICLFVVYILSLWFVSKYKISTEIF